jgi:hypothetical protein
MSKPVRSAATAAAISPDVEPEVNDTVSQPEAAPAPVTTAPSVSAVKTIRGNRVVNGWESRPDDKESNRPFHTIR